ncbi:hypothetical protein WME94_02620 [Sorangium sp. So ce429]
MERAGIDPALVTLLLDAGEAAAIALAEMLRADTLFIDERKGRAIARSRGYGSRARWGCSSRHDAPA